MTEIKIDSGQLMAKAKNIWTISEKHLMANALLDLGIDENSNDTILTSDDIIIIERDDEAYYKELGNYMVLIKKKFNELKGYMSENNLKISQEEIRNIIDKWEDKNFEENISTFMTNHIIDLMLYSNDKIE